MKRILAFFLSFSILLYAPSVYADEASSKLEEVLKITQFLEEYQLVKTCLKNRKDQELKPLSKITASCITLRVFDREKPNFGKSWSRALKLELFSKTENQGQKLSGKEYLTMLFDISGFRVSPILQEDLKKRLEKMRVKMSDPEIEVLATALEYGIFKDPGSEKEALELRKKLRNTLTIAQGLGFLYQTTNAKQEQGTTIVINQVQEGSSVSLKLEGILKNVIESIKIQGYYSDKFDEKKAMHEAIKAVVKTMKENDKYIEYYTEEEFKEFSTGLSGNLEGIGAYIELKDDQIIIVSPIEGTPAYRAGLQPEDVISKINGESTKGMTLQEAVNRIRGPRGTTVALSILRKGVTIEVPIVREQISVPALTVSNRDGFEIIKMTQFSSHSSDEMLKVLEKISKNSPRGIIIDLRNNPGGFLNEVVSIADYFIEKDQPLVVLRDRSNETILKSSIDPLIKKVPIAVLINKGSASASEILAGIFQTYKIGKIYGETSFGKGTVQSVLTLRDPAIEGAAGFKLTTSEYLIGVPGGKDPISINGVGVKPTSNPGGPDSTILDDKDTPQLDEALEKVLELMSQ